MMKFLSNLLNATGVIVGDMIEDWASQVPRAQLIEELRVQTDRINDLEAENDRLHDEILLLREQLQTADERDWGPLTPPLGEFDDYREVTPPIIETEYARQVRVPCPECHNFSCCCIPF